MTLNAVVSSLPRAGTALPPAGADAAAAGGSAFAALLDREQCNAPEPTESASESDAPSSGEPTAAQRAARGAKAPARNAERPATKAPGESHADRPTAPSTAKATEAEADASEPAHGDAPAADPALMHWLQGLNLPPAAVPAEAGGAAARGVRHAAGDGAADPLGADAAGKPSARSPLLAAARGTASDRAGAEALRADPHADGDAALRAEALPGLATGAAEVATATPRFQDTLAALRSGAAEATSASAAAGPAGATAIPSAEATATTAAVPVPLDDPQFPRAFGVQVSVLARDGVQKAELHLNPAEMGPVSVQIVMDGTQARIDFGADAAPTRALIELSLPELAAALREAGLTLAGGGVSQHAGQGRDASGQGPASGPAGRPAAGTDAAAVEPRPLRRSVSAGGLDLYA